MNELPLVTFVLYAFNEQRFIREAIDSAFAQDYSPLEIVLSDDGSTDLTFSIMQEMAEAYSGPHQILLNRNLKNIGIGSQINAAVNKTTGRLIVLANGDDVSHANRVSRLVTEWLGSGEPVAMAVASSLRQIGEMGEDLGRVMDVHFPFKDLETAARGRFGGPGACCLGIDRDVFEAFGPLPNNLILEDTVLLARSMLLGSIRYIDDPLVDYRVHDENISQTYKVFPFEEWRERTRKRAIWHKSQGVKAYIEILRVLQQTDEGLWSRSQLDSAGWVGMEKLMENAILRDYYAGQSTMGDGQKLLMLLRLSVQVMKTRIKRIFPFIERRNERQNYQRTLDAARAEN